MDIHSRLLKKKNVSCRPNIIPILDAVFIFIFFLLMSAEFIKYYVIHSDSPAVKMVDSIGDSDKTPLNLALEILSDRIIVKTNPEGQVREILLLKNNEYDWEKLVKIMRFLKEKNMDENSIILRPRDDIPYKRVIKVIDIVREIPKDSPIIVAANGKGERVQTKTLFDRIIFEHEKI